VRVLSGNKTQPCEVIPMSLPDPEMLRRMAYALQKLPDPAVVGRLQEMSQRLRNTVAALEQLQIQKRSKDCSK